MQDFYRPCTEQKQETKEIEYIKYSRTLLNKIKQIKKENTINKLEGLKQECIVY